MDSNANKDRKTHIIDDAVSLEQSLAQQGRGRGKGKQKGTGGFNLSAPRNAGVSKSKPASKAKATPKLGAQFYEEGGLSIPLHEANGKKKAHARLSATIRNKTAEQLLDIVEAYAGPDKRQEFKTGGSTKATIADWIEEKETLALGPHPKSKLQRRPETGSDREDDFEKSLTGPVVEQPEASGVHAMATKTRVQIPSGEISAKVAAQPGDRKRRAPDEASDGLRQPKHHKRDPQANSQSMSTIPRNGSPAKEKLFTGKRKRDNAAIPTLSRQTAGSSKSYNTPDVSASTTDSLNASSSDLRAKEDSSKVQLEEPVTQPAETADASRDHSSGSNERFDKLLHTFMKETGLDPSQLETSTRIVRLPEQSEDRVLTATSNPQTGRVTLHDTGIPKWYQGFDGTQALRSPAPFLKAGKHGPGGDFDDDPDRVTGQGHDYDPEDLRRYEGYLQFRDAFYKQHRTYPRLQDGEKVRAEVKAAWDNKRMWYNGFAEKYAGHRLDQWVCGCEKMIVESEGESEEKRR